MIKVQSIIFFIFFLNIVGMNDSFAEVDISDDDEIEILYFVGESLRPSGRHTSDHEREEFKDWLKQLTTKQTKIIKTPSFFMTLNISFIAILGSRPANWKCSITP